MGRVEELHHWLEQARDDDMRYVITYMIGRGSPLLDDAVRSWRQFGIQLPLPLELEAEHAARS